MSSGTFHMKTQLPGGDRGNLTLEDLPKADSTCTGDICLATPACSHLTWVTLGLFIFPNSPSALHLTMFLFGPWPYITRKKWSHRKETVKGYSHPKIMIMAMAGLSAWKHWQTSLGAASDNALSAKKTSMKSQVQRIAQNGRDLRRSLLQSPAHSRLSSEVRPDSSGFHPAGAWNPPRTAQPAYLSNCPHGEKLSPYIQAEPLQVLHFISYPPSRHNCEKMISISSRTSP